MALETTSTLIGTVPAVALVGIAGVAAQWAAWRFQLPAIVLLLVFGILVGPVTGILDPAAQFGSLLQPLIALAVAIILFEGGLTLDFKKLAGAGAGVFRLVVIGAPLGWLLSALALRFGAGVSWEVSCVFGGIMIVTGPTVIAPLLRHARLRKRPAALLQWEAIVNDPIGALAAVLAFQVVIAARGADEPGFGALVVGVLFAGALGWAIGWAIVKAFRDALVPEFMKVPVLFTAVIAGFALSDMVLHESGLLAVTVAGIVIANAGLPSYTELRRFKEHATVLLVSGLFILLAASLDVAELGQLTWRAVLFLALIILIARPITVLAALLGTDIPWRERLLVGFTGPRGVVLVAVAGLFGERMAAVGIADGGLVGPLAFVLVAGTVVLHGFTLAPMARAMGLSGGDIPGVLLVGGSRFTTALGEALAGAGLTVLVTDANHGALRRARAAGLPSYYGDILGEAAEHSVEFLEFSTILAASANDAYNTLVVSDLGPEFGRDRVWRLERSKEHRERHALPSGLSGRSLGEGRNFDALEQSLRAGASVKVSGLTEQFTAADFNARWPNALPIAELRADGRLIFTQAFDPETVAPDARLIALVFEERASGSPVDQPSDQNPAR
ncbi:cation:proton antiporter [Poseidonocella sedimentorum]|uniref:NhaP-type Na+/H+ or K+/H+ antiporter n=1 Tax=Poseidonocella sedimentorum TaxID=871652 RepID=A0A1I6E2Z1_9RHOB|nr:sodium:proton antiporter [Poseidonocella sedimentorum]SFR12140.1 NhaP-type Na+/H+ or K+/H+ antiporter [Poseidonocella sedimentorum]